MLNHPGDEPVVTPAEMGRLRPTIIVNVRPHKSIKPDAEFGTAESQWHATEDAALLITAVDTLNTHLTGSSHLNADVGVHIASAGIKEVLEADYRGKDEANITLRIEGANYTIPVTHDSVPKVAKAFNEATKVAQQIETKLKQDKAHHPTDGEIFTNVNAALKSSLKKDGLIVQ